MSKHGEPTATTPARSVLDEPVTLRTLLFMAAVWFGIDALCRILGAPWWHS